MDLWISQRGWHDNGRGLRVRMRKEILTRRQRWKNTSCVSCTAPPTTYLPTLESLPSGVDFNRYGQMKAETTGRTDAEFLHLVRQGDPFQSKLIQDIFVFHLHIYEGDADADGDNIVYASRFRFPRMQSNAIGIGKCTYLGTS